MAPQLAAGLLPSDSWHSVLELSLEQHRSQVWAEFLVLKEEGEVVAAREPREKGVGEGGEQFVCVYPTALPADGGSLLKN